MSTAMQEWPRRHRITVEHFYRMADAGLFEADERVELINGEIIDMPRWAAVTRVLSRQLTTALVIAAGARAIVRAQLPLRLGDDSEPQPDITVVAPRADRYRSSHPRAADALLVIEISDATLRYDRDVKVPMYAQYAVPEVWILDLKANQLHVYAAPRDGTYTHETTVLGPRALATLPDVLVDLSNLL